MKTNSFFTLLARHRSSVQWLRLVFIVSLLIAGLSSTARAVREYGWVPLCFDDALDSFGDDHSDDPCTPPAANDGPEGGDSPCGMPQWRVSEPHINLWLQDTPLRYRLAGGKWMELRLSYKQRASSAADWLGGFGPGWNCNWIGLIFQPTNSGSQLVRVLDGGGATISPSIQVYSNSPPDTETGSQIRHCGPPIQHPYETIGPTGASQQYTGITTLGPEDVARHQVPRAVAAMSGLPPGGSQPVSSDVYLRTKSLDRYGRSTSFTFTNYQWAVGGLTNTVRRLTSVVDRDGRTVTLAYTNTQFPNRITSVTDAYTNRVARFFYDHLGRLTNIVDAVGMASSFAYDESNWITNLHTPYGDTRFRFFGTTTNQYISGSTNNRAIEITEPTSTKQLYAYREVCGTNSENIIGTYAAHDSDQKDLRNSFHWNRAQFAALSAAALTNYLAMPDADYWKASLKHWLIQPYADTNLNLSDWPAAQAGPVLDPANNDVRADQITFQYQGQTNSARSGSLKRVTKIVWNGTEYSAGSSPALEITRNSLGRPTSLTYWLNWQSYTYTNVFDASGTILREVWGPRNERVRGYGYHATYTNLLTSVTNALDEVLRYTHNADFRVTSIAHPSGLLTTNYYYGSGPAQGFLQRSVNVGFSTNAFAWTNGDLAVQTNELGLVTTHTWDALCRPTSTGYPDGTWTSNVWDKLEVVAEKDRTGFWTRRVFNANRQLLYETNANSQVTEFQYCDCGSPSAVIRWNGTNAVVTSYYYDLAGRLTNVIHPDAYQLSYTYDALDRIVTAFDNGGHRVELAYNDFDQITEARVGPENNTLTWLAREFDEYGRATSSMDRNGVTTTSTYDYQGRVLERRAIGVQSTEMSGLESFAYTARGLTNYTDALGNVKRFVRDALGRDLFQTNANQEVLGFTYNPAGQLLTLSDGKQQTTRWNYDAEGRVTNKVDATSAEMFRYQYDPEGRLTNRWQAGGISTTFRYDPVGNLTNVVYPTSPALVLRYDALNRLTNLVDGIGSTAFGWTSGNQLAREDGPWGSDTVSYGYSSRMRNSLTVQQPNAAPWGQSYGYDAYWRLTNVTSLAGVFGTSYKSVTVDDVPLAADLVARMDLPGGSFIENTQDSLGRLLSTVLKQADATVVNSHAYEYNDGHQRTKQTFTAGNTMDYTYDDLGQLKTAKGMEADATTPRLHEQFGYAYDAAWNLSRRTNNALVQTFNVNTLNELTTLGRSGTLTVAGAVSAPPTGVTVKDNANSAVAATVYGDQTFAREGVSLLDGTNVFTAVAEDTYGRHDTNVVTVNLPASVTCYYDTRGNLTNDGRRVFSYDDENQLVSVTESNAWRSEFVYDGFLRRRVRKEYVWQHSLWQCTNEVRYVYDGGVVVQERHFAPQLSTTTPQQLVTYTRGNDLSGTMQGAGGIGGLLARSEVPSSILQLPSSPLHALYHADGNGNVTCLISTNGLLLARYSYDPYGNTLAAFGPLAEANLYRFSSKEWHPNSSLVYYLYRFYEPSLQRWVNRDPIGIRGGINLYRYVRNKPTSRIDPLGLCGEYSLMGMGGQGMANFASPQGVTGLAEALGAAQQSGYPADQVVSASANEAFKQSMHIPVDEFVFVGAEFPLGLGLDGEFLGLFGINDAGLYYGGLGAIGPRFLKFGYEQTSQGGEYVWLLDPGAGWGLYHSKHSTGGFAYWPPGGHGPFIGCGIGLAH